MKPKYRLVAPRRILASVSTSVVLCMAGSAMAQTDNNWTGTVSSDWNNVANWSAGVLPTKTGNYHAVINTATPNIATITVASLILSLLATLYPSWSASRVQPAQALRYE